MPPAAPVYRRRCCRHAHATTVTLIFAARYFFFFFADVTPLSYSDATTPERPPCAARHAAKRCCAVRFHIITLYARRAQQRPRPFTGRGSKMFTCRRRSGRAAMRQPGDETTFTAPLSSAAAQSPVRVAVYARCQAARRKAPTMSLDEKINPFIAQHSASSAASQTMPQTRFAVQPARRAARYVVQPDTPPPACECRGAPACLMLSKPRNARDM